MIITTDAEYAEFLAVLDRTAGMVVLDTETHKTPTPENRVPIGIAIGIPRGMALDTYYLPVHQPISFVEPELREILLNKEWIMHNARFDLEVMKRLGVDNCEKPFYDTLIMAHLCDENEYDYGLDALGRKYFNHPKPPMNLWEKGYGGWHKIPTEIMGAYAENDLSITWELFIKYFAEIQSQGLGSLLQESHTYVRTLQDVCNVGIIIDNEELDKAYLDRVQRIADIERELGCKPSGNALHTYVFETLGCKPVAITAKGKPSLDDNAVRTLILTYPSKANNLRLVREWRKTNKDKGVFEGFRRLQSPSGRLYPGIKQHGTKTGRLSCAEPNLQQLPRDRDRGKVFFLPPPGFALIEFDYSQIELRVGARYAKKFHDSTMYDMYKEDVDVHTETTQLIGADKLVGSTFKEYKDARQTGKVANFLWIYGGGAPKFRSMLWDQFEIKISTDQAETMSQAFKTAYPGFMRAQQNYTKKHKEQGYVEYWNRRRRRIKDRKASDHTIMHYRAFNSIVQGGCGQVLMVALGKLLQARKEGFIESQMVNTVHDSIWFYVPERKVEEEVEKIKAIMAEIPEKVFGLPFDVSAEYLNVAVEDRDIMELEEV